MNSRKTGKKTPRQAAIKQIVIYYFTESRTKELLQNRADNDPDEKYRLASKN
jgi:hypothetical protein